MVAPEDLSSLVVAIPGQDELVPLVFRVDLMQRATRAAYLSVIPALQVFALHHPEMLT
jgi:hypothetical protein